MEELATVNRIEVVDWTESTAGGGRAYTKWIEDNFQVSYQLQDDGRTLKIFLTDEGDS